MVALTTEDLMRLETASRTLLTPLAAPDLDAWRREVMGAVRALFRARGATFCLPGAPAFFLGDEVDAAVLDGVETYLGPTWRGDGPSPNPLVNVFHDTVVGMRLRAWDFPLIDHVMQGNATRFDYYHEVMVPGRITDTHTLFVPTPSGSAMLEVHDLRHPLDGGTALPLLHVLLPAFEAGLDTLARLHAHRAALDIVEEPLSAFDPDGNELHRNRALVRLLSEDPEAAALDACLRRLGAQVRRLVVPGDGPPPAVVTCRTTRGAYTFRATALPPGLFGAEPATLVTVAADRSPTLPAPDTVRERFGLTRREAEVALLLAEGISNDALAERLFISPHTARRHTENVLAKMELNSRKALALRLLQPA